MDGSEGEFHTHTVNKNDILRFVQIFSKYSHLRLSMTECIYDRASQGKEHAAHTNWPFSPNDILAPDASITSIYVRMHSSSNRRPHGFNYLPRFPRVLFYLYRAYFQPRLISITLLHILKTIFANPYLSYENYDHDRLFPISFEGKCITFQVYFIDSEIFGLVNRYQKA